MPRPGSGHGFVRECILPAQWLRNSNAAPGRLGHLVSPLMELFSGPSGQRRLRRGLMVILLLWAIFALSRLIWALVPIAEPVPESMPEVMNPVVSGSARVGAEPIDIDQVVAWHLFGKPGAAVPVSVEPVKASQDSAREGIEKGARETRLNVVLRGIVASTEDGLGRAVIESKKRQAVYAVGDKLPVPGRVELAKVMPTQVVIDNGGTYELLVLFDKSVISKALTAEPRPAPAAVNQAEKRADAQTTELARSYRERLYEDPQSLSSVVNVAAVRDDGSLRGYRVNPGRDREQFAQLGFKAGDLVLAVNGVNLDNPANTMVLYTGLRDASEAVFEIERDGEQLTLSVNLDNGATE